MKHTQKPQQHSSAIVLKQSKEICSNLAACLKNHYGLFKKIYLSNILLFHYYAFLLIITHAFLLNGQEVIQILLYKYLKQLLNPHALLKTIHEI